MLCCVVLWRGVLCCVVLCCVVLCCVVLCIALEVTVPGPGPGTRLRLFGVLGREAFALGYLARETLQGSVGSSTALRLRLLCCVVLCCVVLCKPRLI